MFKINNSEIGKYLSRLIKDQYSSDRRFCIEYLKLRDDRNDVENSDDIQKMQNRICQINNGNKNIYGLLEMMKKSIVVHGIIKINTLAASVPVPRLNEEK